jgi:hypothetical protein
MKQTETTALSKKQKQESFFYILSCYNEALYTAPKYVSQHIEFRKYFFL